MSDWWLLTDERNRSAEDWINHSSQTVRFTLENGILDLLPEEKQIEDREDVV